MEFNVTSSNIQAPQAKKQPTLEPRKIACPLCRLKKRACNGPQIGAPCQTCVEGGQRESCKGSMPTDAKLGKQQESQKTYVHVSVQTEGVACSGCCISEERFITLPQTCEQDESLRFPMSFDYRVASSSGEIRSSTVYSGEYHYENGQTVGNNHMMLAPPYQGPFPQQALYAYAYQSIDSADPTYRHEFMPSESPHDVSAADSSQGRFSPSNPSREYQL